MGYHPSSGPVPGHFSRRQARQRSATTSPVAAAQPRLSRSSAGLIGPTTREGDLPGPQRAHPVVGDVEVLDPVHLEDPGPAAGPLVGQRDEAPVHRDPLVVTGAPLVGQVEGHGPELRLLDAPHGEIGGVHGAVEPGPTFSWMTPDQPSALGVGPRIGVTLTK